MRTHARGRKNRDILRKKVKFTKSKGEKMKETTNIKIDSDLKKLFQSADPMHRMTIGEAAELGMRYVLVGLKQKQLVEQELKRTELDLLEISQRQAVLKLLSEQLNNIKIEITENKSNGNSAEIEKTRDEKFQQSKASIIKLWKKGDINWDSVVPSYQFADKKEAQEWFKNKIEGETNNG